MASRAAASTLPQTTPTRRYGSVAKASIVTVTAVLLSRVIGLLRDMVISHQFGESLQTDAYNAAFSVPDLLMYLIAGGALSSTFIPVFSDYLHKKDLRGAWTTFSVVGTVTAVIATLFVVIGELFTPQLTHLLNPGYSDSHLTQLQQQTALALTTDLTRIVLPAQIFFLLGGLLMGTLNARGQFLVPMLGPTIYNLGIIFGAVFLRGMGIHGLMWGALAGAFIGNFALQIVFVAREGVRFRPNLNIFHPGAVKVFKLMLPILLGVSLPNVDQIINRYFASELAVGSQTAITIAVRLMLIPIGVFAQAIGIAILPTLSSQAAANDRKEMRRTVVQGLRTILYLTIPASMLMFALAHPVISLLYQHGKFSAADVNRTAIPLQFYSLGIFAWSAQAILTRGFYALQDSRTPVVSGTIMTVVFICMNWFVVHETHFGIAGLATATSIAATLHMVVMLVMLNRRLQKIANTTLLISVLQTLVATAVLGTICIAGRHLFEFWITNTTHSSLGHFLASRLGTGLEIIIVSFAGIVGLIVVSKMLNMSEYDQIARIALPKWLKVISLFNRKTQEGEATKANGMA